MDRQNLMDLFKLNEQSVLLSNDVTFTDAETYKNATHGNSWPHLWVVHPATRSFYKVTARNVDRWLQRFNGSHYMQYVPLILRHLAEKEYRFYFVVCHNTWKQQTEHTLAKFLQRVATPRYSVPQANSNSLLWCCMKVTNKRTGMCWHVSGPKGESNEYYANKIQVAAARWIRRRPQWMTDQHFRVVERIVNLDLKFIVEDLVVAEMRDLTKKQVDSHIFNFQTRQNISEISRFAGIGNYLGHVDLSALGRLDRKMKPAFLLN